MQSEWLARLEPRAISILIYFLLILYLLRPNVLKGQSGRVILLLRWCLLLNAIGELIIKFGDLMLPLSATASLLVGRGLTTSGFFLAYLSLSEIAGTPAPRWLRFALLYLGAAAGLGLSTLWLNSAVAPDSLSELLEGTRTAMVLFEGVLFALFIPLFYRLTRRETALLGRTRFGLFLLAVIWGEVVIVLYFVGLFARYMGQTELAAFLDKIAFWFDLLNTIALITGLLPAPLLRRLIEGGVYFNNQIAILELRYLIAELDRYAPKFQWPTPTLSECLRDPHFALYGFMTRALDQIYFLRNRSDLPQWLQALDLHESDRDQLGGELRALAKRSVQARLALFVALGYPASPNPLPKDVDQKN